jgi:aminoglycoside phosphotransferase (APT) family kinase protein
MRLKPLQLPAYAQDLARLHLVLHGSPAPELPAQRGRLAHAIQAAKALPEAQRQRALQMLERLPDGDRLCHGDFHPDNVLLTARGPLVIDWMTAAQGHPAADVARTRLLLTIGDPPNQGAMRLLLLLGRSQFARGYSQTYQRGAPEVFRQSQAFLPVMAAARLNEEIAPEREKLLKLIG